jgi:hypothetical protein
VTELGDFIRSGRLSGHGVGAMVGDVVQVVGYLGEKPIRSKPEYYILRYGAVQFSFKGALVTLIKLESGIDSEETPAVFRRIAAEVDRVGTFADCVQLFRESEVDWWVDGPACIGRRVCLRTDNVRVYFDLERMELVGILTAW